MAEKSVIIIGAGLAGLSAGCFAQMNGYRTEIFEKHIKAGGLCTTWKRKGYTIGTPGWIMGSRPANNDYHRVWQELGALQGRSMIDYDEMMRIEGEDGQVFVIYTDIDRLEQHMLELAPEDADVIAGFAQALRAFTRFKMPTDKAPEVSGLLGVLKMLWAMLPHMGLMRKWMGLSLRDFAGQFKNAFLRRAFEELADQVAAAGRPGIAAVARRAAGVRRGEGLPGFGADARRVVAGELTARRGPRGVGAGRCGTGGRGIGHTGAREGWGHGTRG